MDECVPFRFSLPALPARAVSTGEFILEGGDSRRHVRALAEDVDLIAGWKERADEWSQSRTSIDHRSLEQLGFPALIVARSGLGTINHSLLTLMPSNKEASKPWAHAARALLPSPVLKRNSLSRFGPIN